MPFQNIWPSVTCLDIIFRQLSKNGNKAPFSLVLFGSLTKGINPSCFTNKPWIIPAIRSASGFGFSATWKRHGSQPIVQSTENTPYHIKNHFTISWLDELRHPKWISKTTCSSGPILSWTNLSTPISKIANTCHRIGLQKWWPVLHSNLSKPQSMGAHTKWYSST